MAQRNWGAIIAGEETDLQAWSSVLKPPFDPWVEVHGKDTILRSSSLNDLPDSSEARDRSLPYIDILNGAFALAQSAKPIRFNGVVEIAANGLLHRHLFVELFNDAAYEIRGTAATVQVITYGPDGKPISPPLSRPSSNLGRQRPNRMNGLRMHWFILADQKIGLTSTRPWNALSRSMTVKRRSLP